MSQIKQLLYSFTRYCSDLVLPPVCIACKTSTHQHETLCPTCWYQTNFIVPPICDRLGIPLPYSLGGTTVSAAALAYPPVFNRARSVAHFEGPVKSMIHALKYADQHEGVKLFSRWMSQAGKDILNKDSLIIPVPLSRTRLWSRRFNQSALLAQAIGAYCNIPVNCLSIKRVKHTRAQVGLTRKQREKNVSAAFKVPKTGLSAIQDKNIVLVDDVLTTGATINACTKALLKAKANKVDVLTLARVVDPVLLGD